MRCLYPYMKLVREDGKIAGFQAVPCGHCSVCQENYKNDWAVRVKHELSFHKSSVFITLTYNDVHLSLQNLEYDDGTFNSLQKDEVSLFMKRLRRQVEPRKIRFFASGEYGDENLTRRPHYHILIFGLDKHDELFKDKVPIYRNGAIKYYYIEKFPFWTHGHVEISYRTPDAKSAQYITKYVAKKKGLLDKDYYKLRKIHPEFLLMSRNPGIGYNGIKESARFYLTHPYGTIGNAKVRLPRYIVDKVDELSDFDFKGSLEYERSLLSYDDLTDNQKRQVEKQIAKKNNKRDIGVIKSGCISL